MLKINRMMKEIADDCVTETIKAPTPYVIRENNGNINDKEWSTHNIILTVSNHSTNVKITLPPEPPFFCLMGASHVDRMLSVSLEYSEDMKLKKSWMRTVFVKLTGYQENFMKFFALIHANLTKLIKEKFKVFSSHPMIMLIFPFSHDIPYGPHNIFVKTAVRNLINAGRHIAETIDHNPFINFCFNYLEIPVWEAHQDRSIKLNKVVREVNTLLDRFHVPARGWIKALSPIDMGRPNPKRLTTTNFLRLKFKPEHYEADYQHLSNLGNVDYLCQLYSVYGFGINDREASHDFPGFRNVIQCEQYQHNSYFRAVYLQKVAHMKDSTDINNLHTLNLLTNYSVNTVDIEIKLRNTANANMQTLPMVKNHLRGPNRKDEDPDLNQSGIRNRRAARRPNPYF